MRQALSAVAAAVVIACASWTPAAAQAVRVWSGKGASAKASDGANWEGGRAPENSDRVVFGNAGKSRECLWDYDVELSSLTLTGWYHARVSLTTHAVRVRENVRVSGGTLDLDHGTLEVGNLLYLHKSGTLQLSEGALRLGRKGFLVDDGGTLLSTGNKPASVTSATGDYYPFAIAEGSVTLADAAGTTIERSKGIVIYSRAVVARAEDVNVRQVEKGAPGVKIYSKPGEQLALVDWTFDDSVTTPLETPNAAKGANVTLTQAAPPPPPPPAPAAPPAVSTSAEALLPPMASTPAVAMPPIDIDNTVMGRALANEQGVQITPFFSAQLLGGQYFYQNQQGDLSGDLNLLAAPSMKFNDSWTLIPSYAGTYQGTKEVLDLVGAGTLFSERLDNRIGVRGVFTPDDGDSDWRLKPSVNFKYEFLKETNDETWGTGLFDYWRAGAGMEAEYLYAKPFSVRVSYDYGYTHFPNYSSLESQQTLDFNGQPLARELVGTYVLDTNTHGLTLSASAPLGKGGMVVEGTSVLLYQEYPYQHLVNGAGALTNPYRQDLTEIVDVTVRRPQPVDEGLKFVESMGLGATFSHSNQNSYDASNTRYLPGYYNYNEVRADPSLSVYLGKPTPELQPISISLNGNFWYRDYYDRPPQNTDGSYQSGSIHQINWLVGTTLTYPMDRNFSLLANIQYGQASSNMAFQEYYTYNYNAFTYLIGASFTF